ncbi:MAG: AAA family ATPase [Fusobacteriaceae bacterium]
MAKKGKYIILEGMPGSGKTTLGKEIAKQSGWQYIKSLPSDRTIISIEDEFKGVSEKDRRQLRNLLFAADLISDEYRIEKLVNEGINIVRDKSLVSSLAHLYSQVDKSENLSIEIRKFIENLSSQFVLPEAVIFLDTTFEDSVFYKITKDDISAQDDILFSDKNNFDSFKNQLYFFLNKFFNSNSILFKKEKMNPEGDAKKILELIKGESKS